MNMRFLVRLIMVFLLLLYYVGCAQPRRPAGVSIGAVRVESVKGGYWQKCEMSESAQTRCVIWNEGGVILFDEVFLPVDGGSTPSAKEVSRLRTWGPCTGAYQVCLENRRILVPRSHFDEMKAHIERLSKE